MVDSASKPDDRGLAKLARGSRADREAALHALHERFKDEVFGFLSRLLRDETLAEDALQETFLNLYASFDRFEPGQPFRPWVFKIARNAALMSLRKRKKDERLETRAARPDAVPGDPSGEVVATEARARVREALERLPDETRALLLQRHVLAMKLTDLAQSFSCTERTVRNRLHDAASAFAGTLLERRTP